MPVLVARGILAAGDVPVAAGLIGETGSELGAIVPSLAFFPVGALGEITGYFIDQGVAKLIMAGKVRKAPVFSGTPLFDPAMSALLARLPRRNDDAILGAVVDHFTAAGLTVLPQAAYLPDLLVPKGVLSARQPDERERADISFGFEMAKQIGALDFGQSVVVKGLAVLAVEAVEGTDETIRRGGRLGQGGAVLVKVSKPSQDPRFDIPTVGPDTIAAMIESGIGVLAIEAARTFFMDQERSLAAANAAGLAVVSVDNTGGF